MTTQSITQQCMLQLPIRCVVLVDIDATGVQRNDSNPNIGHECQVFGMSLLPLAQRELVSSTLIDALPLWYGIWRVACRRSSSDHATTRVCCISNHIERPWIRHANDLMDEPTATTRYSCGVWRTFRVRCTHSLDTPMRFVTLISAFRIMKLVKTSRSYRGPRISTCECGGSPTNCSRYAQVYNRLQTIQTTYFELNTHVHVPLRVYIGLNTVRHVVSCH
jgi:hypothetical protein